MRLSLPRFSFLFFSSQSDNIHELVLSFSLHPHDEIESSKFFYHYKQSDIVFDPSIEEETRLQKRKTGKDNYMVREED